jgi:hypothetical protein
LSIERAQEIVKGFPCGQWPEAAGKRELALRKGALQTVNELAAKDTAQYLYRQEEWIARMNPVLAVEG